MLTNSHVHDTFSFFYLCIVNHQTSSPISPKRLIGEIIVSAVFLIDENEQCKVFSIVTLLKHSSER